MPLTWSAIYGVPTTVSQNNVHLNFPNVQPILEYNSIIWSPSRVWDIEQIEKVKRRLTKRLRDMKHFVLQ